MRSFNWNKLYYLFVAKSMLLASTSTSNAFLLESWKSISPLENLFNKSGLSFDEFSKKLSVSKSSLIKHFNENTENELSKKEKVKAVESQIRETINEFSELLQKDGLTNAIKLDKINLSSKSDLNLIKKEIEKIILENGSFKANNFAQLSENTISNLQEANIRLESNKAEKSFEKTLQEKNDPLMQKTSEDNDSFFDTFLNNSTVSIGNQTEDTSLPLYYYAGIPFGLLALGGGGGGGTSTASSQVLSTINANVIKGPVGNAFVF